jgi:hypothetical protein
MYYSFFQKELSVKDYINITKKGCWVLKYIELFKIIKIKFFNTGVINMFELNLDNEQKSVFLGLLNGLILADGVISPKETEKWNFFASLFEGITYKLVPEDSLKNFFSTKKTKSSVLLELMSVALGKESAEPEDRAFIDKVAQALDVDKDIQKRMWVWVERMLALINESNEFME